MLLCLWMFLLHRTRKGLEVKHWSYLFSLNKQQAHFKKKSSFFIGDGDDGHDDGDDDDNGGSGGDDDDQDGDMTNLFYTSEVTDWRIICNYAFSLLELTHY